MGGGNGRKSVQGQSNPFQNYQHADGVTAGGGRFDRLFDPFAQWTTGKAEPALFRPGNGDRAGRVDLADPRRHDRKYRQLARAFDQRNLRGDWDFRLEAPLVDDQGVSDPICDRSPGRVWSLNRGSWGGPDGGG